MRLSSFIIVALMLLAAVVFVSPVSAADTAPVFPHAFKGDVLVNGNPAPDGCKVSATVSEGNVVIDEQNPVTTTGGSYGKGGTLCLVVQGDIPSGATINFYVDGVKASNTTVYHPGNIDTMNLSVSITPTPTKRPHHGGGGGGGGGSASPSTPVEEFKTTGTLDTNSDGIVQDAIEVLTADEKEYLSIPKGTKALNAEGLPLKDVIIQSTDDISGTSGFTFAGHAVDASPAGATFDPTVTLTFQLTEEEWANLPAGNTFAVKWFNAGTGAWEDVPTSVHAGTHSVSAKVSHFSKFAVFMQETSVVDQTSPTKTASVTTAPVGTGTTPVASPDEFKFPWIMIISIIVVLAIICAGYWYYTNQK